MRLMSGLMLAPVLAALVNARFEAYGYFYTFVDSFAHLGGVIAGITCTYFFLPCELLSLSARGGAISGVLGTLSHHAILYPVVEPQREDDGQPAVGALAGQQC